MSDHNIVALRRTERNSSAVKREIVFRAARPGDADDASQLIYSAAPDLFDYGYTTKRQHALEFIHHAFKSGMGFLGYRNQTVGLYQGRVIFITTLYPGHLFLNLSLQTLALSLNYYGIGQGCTLIGRAFKIRSLFTTPQKSCLFIANCSVSPEYRGQGVFRKFMPFLKRQATSKQLDTLELDVSVSNPRAQSLYQKLGFRVIEDRDYIGKEKLSGVRRMRRPVVADHA